MHPTLFIIGAILVAVFFGVPLIAIGASMERVRTFSQEDLDWIFKDSGY